MMESNGSEPRLGINGLGGIGKQTLWYHVARKYFGEIVVNIGRQAGRSLHDVAHYLERDSIFGWLQQYIYGYNAGPVIDEIEEDSGTMRINGVKVRFLRNERHPSQIDWLSHRIGLVIDTTGKFTDPTKPPNDHNGSLRGHFEAGADYVIVSAPFNSEDNGKYESLKTPSDCITIVAGINERQFDPNKHKIVSAASSTSCCLAHLINPLIRRFGTKKMLTASLTTVHAVTATQSALDRLPKSRQTDLRHNRSILDNIILTDTDAAETIKSVIPETQQIGLIAQAMRVPVSTGSIVSLVVNFQEEEKGVRIDKALINHFYKMAQSEYLQFSEIQSVSRDIVRHTGAGIIIEGRETQTLAADVTIDLGIVPGFDKRILSSANQQTVTVPVTQAVIYAWFDNKLSGYVGFLGQLTVNMAKKIYDR